MVGSTCFLIHEAQQINTMKPTVQQTTESITPDFQEWASTVKSRRPH